MRLGKKTNQKKLSNEFIGTLFSIDKHYDVSVILVPGSDGGVPIALANYIASHGYPTLALGYFGVDGLPSTLNQIPLEYFLNPINFLKNKFKKVILMGYSRGGELVLLLSSYFPNMMDGIIAHVPSSMVCGGFPNINLPAWTFNNDPIQPFVNGLMDQSLDFTESDDLKEACRQGVIPFHEGTKEDPYEIVDLFKARQKTKSHLMQTMIPVENISCPLLILAGEDDKIWPSAEYGRNIINRIKLNQSSIKRKLMIYPQAGHGFIAQHNGGSIFHPIGNFWCRLGGTEEGNRAANKKSWSSIFEFLTHLTQ